MEIRHFRRKINYITISSCDTGSHTGCQITEPTIDMAKQRTEKKQITRQKILLASMELFHTNGFDATSYAQIAKHAGVGYGTVYSHYPTKESMLLEQMQMLMQQQIQALIEQDRGARSHLEHALYLGSHAWSMVSMLPSRLVSVYMAHRWMCEKPDFIDSNRQRDKLLAIIGTHFEHAQTEGDLSADINIPLHIFIMDACYIKATQAGRFCVEDRERAKAAFDQQMRYMLGLNSPKTTLAP
ncbi:MAG: hypothetical protein COA69_08270 [Robiginitomaculum sp.]|nr:MAG: hypothetical protein COA69_08270 [Robiginitomaculum sp.]